MRDVLETIYYNLIPKDNKPYYMLQTKRVRQGAIIVNIQPDAKVTYEVSLCVPKDFKHEDASLRGNKKMIVKCFDTWEAAMRCKINLQIKVQNHKNALGIARSQRLLLLSTEFSNKL